ncbi:MAG TPA: RNA polymerase sigma factor RpoD/SigA [Patescibacteria group bacterium]|jgi:RNA polymerase primary sigma factor|nr:RNA polymerase sigma factor RpoD/SigA [Patescibacteria group bacterium]
MKLETPLQKRTPAASREESASTPKHNNLRKVSPLKPAKLKSGRNGGLSGSRGSRGNHQPKTATPVVLLPENEEAAGQFATEPLSSASSRGDNLQLYLREIGQVQLLTPEQEIQLAKRIHKGDEAAREHMIKANLRLVVKIARDYEGLGLPLLDLINEGNIGLMKGVERFNPAKGAKLSTYAALWIKQAIRRALGNQSKTIRLPVHVVDKMAHIRNAERKLREALGREATDEEVAEEMGFSLRQVKLYREAGKAPVSLDAPLSEGEDGKQVAEVVADPNAVGAYDQMVKQGDSELLQEVLQTLSERERNILKLRFGLDGDSPMTLEEVGEQYKLTRERIRQIQEEALMRLRARMKERDTMPEEEDVFAFA